MNLMNGCSLVQILLWFFIHFISLLSCCFDVLMSIVLSFFDKYGYNSNMFHLPLNLKIIMSFETFINIFCRRFLFIGFFFIEFKELFISFDIFFLFSYVFSLKHIQRHIFTFFARFCIIHFTFHSVQSLFQFFFLVENYITSNDPTYFHFFFRILWLLFLLEYILLSTHT